MASGACLAGVGKHEAKLEWLQVRRVWLIASPYSFCKRAARGPGVAAIGGAAAGDGERDVVAGIGG